MLSRLIILISLFPCVVISKVDWTNRLSLSSNATYVESSTQQARSFGLVPALSIDINISQNLVFKAMSSAILETGSHKGTLLDEFKPDQQVVLNYGYFSYNPFESNQIELGALPMSERAPSLLIAGTRFLGAEILQKISLWGEAKLNFYALSAIPSNQELTNRLGGVSEGTPGYQQLGINLSLPGDLIGIKFNAFAWSFNNVTGNVAYQSGFMGNQTQGVGSANTRLSYDYKGLASTFLMNGEIAAVHWGLLAEILYNDGAPDGRNKAMRLSPSIELNSHSFALSWFEIEADAAIGYYNNANYGHTNRSGFALDYKLSFNEEEAFGISVARSNVLKATLLQSDQDYLKMWWSFQLK